MKRVTISRCLAASIFREHLEFRLFSFVSHWQRMNIPHVLHFTLLFLINYCGQIVEVRPAYVIAQLELEAIHLAVEIWSLHILNSLYLAFLHLQMLTISVLMMIQCCVHIKAVHLHSCMILTEFCLTNCLFQRTCLNVKETITHSKRRFNRT